MKAMRWEVLDKALEMGPQAHAHRQIFGGWNGSAGRIAERNERRR